MLTSYYHILLPLSYSCRLPTNKWSQYQQVRSVMVWHRLIFIWLPLQVREKSTWIKLNGIKYVSHLSMYRTKISIKCSRLTFHWPKIFAFKCNSISTLHIRLLSDSIKSVNIISETYSSIVTAFSLTIKTWFHLQQFNFTIISRV